MTGRRLTDRQRAMLELEGKWWQYYGVKEGVIREQFGCSPTRFYQELNILVDTEAALAHDPILVKRLRGQRLRRTG